MHPDFPVVCNGRVLAPHRYPGVHDGYLERSQGITRTFMNAQHVQYRIVLHRARAYLRQWSSCLRRPLSGICSCHE
jgi:hypothetical protein